MECICCRTGVTLVRDIVPPASSQYLLATKLMDTVQNCSITTNYAEFSYITCKQTVATRIGQCRRMPASGSPRPIPASGRVVPPEPAPFYLSCNAAADISTGWAKNCSAFSALRASWDRTARASRTFSPVVRSPRAALLAGRIQDAGGLHLHVGRPLSPRTVVRRTPADKRPHRFLE